MKQALRVGSVLSVLMLLNVGAAGAHCDSMDGPVVKAAQHALTSGMVAHALVWVKPEHEKEIREAFTKTLAVRKLGGAAVEMADRWFFETLVRVHREGEGEPFTGLKPAGYYNDPAYVAADRALETGSFEPISEIPAHVGARLKELHTAAVAAKNFAAGDVEAGRKYVALYTEYVHYVEQLARLTHHQEHGHHD